MQKEQSKVDDQQTNQINRNSAEIESLGYRMERMDTSLSSGIASAMALGAMPTMSTPGAHMITGGSGFFNGEGAVAVGLSGTTDSGKVSYKLGGTYTKEGGSGFSMGGGYRWK